LFLLISIILLSTLANEYQGYTFEQYTKEYKKTYPLQSSEYNLRKEIFELRLKEIITHNENPSFTWKLGVNQFTDMTEAERKSFLGLNKKLLYHSYLKRANLNSANWERPIDQTESMHFLIMLIGENKELLLLLKIKDNVDLAGLLELLKILKVSWLKKLIL